MDRSLTRSEHITTPFEYATRPRLAIDQTATGLVGFLGLHLILGVALQRSPALAPSIATLHGLIICALSLWAILRWKVTEIACVAAYVAGADVLWRMTGANLPWEIAKYLIVVLSLGGILRMGRRAEWNALALIYFLGFIPSIIVLPAHQTGSESLTQSISFNLSGPLCLFASAWFMSQLRLTRSQVRTLLVSLIAPVLTIAVITLLTTSGATDLTFTEESNLVTSGGFGPNQVSVTLGLAALSSLILAIDPDVRLSKRSIAFVLVLFFAIQSAMTFSRGGLYSVAIALLFASILFYRDRLSRKWLFRITLVGAAIALVVVLPRLETFTGGELGERFADTNPGHRMDVIQEDLRLWGEHPIFGVGPGAARDMRRGEVHIAHTELTRMLSEHGLFGAMSLVALIALLLTQLMRRQSHREKALRIAFMTWSLSCMLQVGMRTAAVGLVFAWGCSRVLLAKDPTLASTSSTS